MAYDERIIKNPTTAGGEPIIRSIQMPVHEVLARVAANMSLELDAVKKNEAISM